MMEDHQRPLKGSQKLYFPNGAILLKGQATKTRGSLSLAPDSESSETVVF